MKCNYCYGVGVVLCTDSGQEELCPKCLGRGSSDSHLTVYDLMEMTEEDAKKIIDNACKLAENDSFETFSTGAVRDIHTGKLRYDLIPVEFYDVYTRTYNKMIDAIGSLDVIINNLNAWKKTGNIEILKEVLIHICAFAYKDIKHYYIFLPQIPVLKAYADILTSGAEKYSDRNWEKGMPVSRMYASLLRHLFAYAEGDESENHLGAAIFNCFGIIYYKMKIDEGILPKELWDV